MPKTIKKIGLVCLLCGLLVLVSNSQVLAQRQPSVTVLDFGQTSLGKLSAEKIRTGLRAKGEFLIADADLTRSAAMGIGYSGSLNLTVSEARDLGAALASDFYFLGDAQTVRRSSFKTPVYYESYCSVFLVESRTGRLVAWERPSFENNEATIAEEQLSQHLSRNDFSQRLVIAIRRAIEDEQIQRTLVAPAAPLIEEAPDDEKVADAQGLRLPRPYRRLRPEYPESAARAEAEATVDVLVDVGPDGKVGDVQVVRWAGFGLDHATVATVRQMNFFPAMKNGTAIPMRVLLRYNFRKPPPTR